MEFDNHGYLVNKQNSELKGLSDLECIFQSVTYD